MGVLKEDYAHDRKAKAHDRKAKLMINAIAYGCTE
jgi:hypothetical protein